MSAVIENFGMYKGRVVRVSSADDSDRIREKGVMKGGFPDPFTYSVIGTVAKPYAVYTRTQIRKLLTLLVMFGMVNSHKSTKRYAYAISIEVWRLFVSFDSIEILYRIGEEYVGWLQVVNTAFNYNRDEGNFEVSFSLNNIRISEYATVSDLWAMPFYRNLDGYGKCEVDIEELCSGDMVGYWCGHFVCTNCYKGLDTANRAAACPKCRYH